ncbi:hypothetical protein MUK42_11035 [Musa troglodytarum]|uniref:Uncharacterized protein n=1 Tax=Musa troglodytarum TaxID=320322 RepID=A0A9E7GA13_9LILI|nr:hypothetical protein MUK42_11035 [Musa troglodytarum]
MGRLPDPTHSSIEALKRRRIPSSRFVAVVLGRDASFLGRGKRGRAWRWSTELVEAIAKTLLFPATALHWPLGTQSETPKSKEELDNVVGMTAMATASVGIAR